MVVTKIESRGENVYVRAITTLVGNDARRDIPRTVMREAKVNTKSMAKRYQARKDIIFVRID